jgi:hypothetical protein
MPARTLALVLVALALACSARREGPSANGDVPPPPDLQGRIARIGDGAISLATDPPDPARPPVDVAVRGTTRITTARGESVAPGDLVVGMRAKVWLDSRSAGPLKLAAKIVIASKDPSADWPHD